VSYSYDYPRPGLTVDCVVFGLDDGALKVLLIKRQQPPFRHRWALPGGYVEIDESVDAAARRELAEETAVTDVFLEQLYTFGAVDRDPRGRTVSVAYYALINLLDHPVAAASDAEEAAWFELDDVPELAFDHGDILATARERLRGKVRYAPIGFELLPAKFTLTELQTLYETVLERPLDKRNFRKKILSMGLLHDTGELQKDVAHRAARLYRFDRGKYDQLSTQGFSFAI
jgi:8-oxo-dGTP diphosphatase